MTTIAPYSLVIDKDRIPTWKFGWLFAALVCYAIASQAFEGPFTAPAIVLVLGILVGHPLYDEYVRVTALAVAYPQQTVLKLERMKVVRTLMLVHGLALIMSNFSIVLTVIHAPEWPHWSAFLVIPLWGYYFSFGRTLFKKAETWQSEPLNVGLASPRPKHFPMVIQLVSPPGLKAMDLKLAPDVLVLDASNGCWAQQMYSMYPFQELCRQATRVVVAPQELLSQLHKDPEALWTAVDDLRDRYQIERIHVWVDASWHSQEKWRAVADKHEGVVLR